MNHAYEISDTPENVINYFDMLNTFYNWTVPENIVHQWYHQAGFVDVLTLNKSESNACASHVIGKKPH